jgi:hypothetical protein
MSKLTEWRDAQARTRAARAALDLEVEAVRSAPTPENAGKACVAVHRLVDACAVERYAAWAVDNALDEVS